MAKKEIKIDNDGNPDEPKQPVKKSVDTVRWKSQGDSDWTVDFDGHSPLQEGYRIYVPSNGSSEECKIKDDADLGEYEYQVLPDSQELPKKKLEESGPVIIVEAGNGNVPPDKGKGKKKKKRKTGKVAAKKAAGRKSAGRKSARNAAARKGGGRKTAARKSKRPASRRRAAKKR